MSGRATLAGAVLLLAACGGSNAQLQPGRWEMTQGSEVTPQSPDWRGVKTSPDVRYACITPAQAARPTAELLLGMREGSCTGPMTMEGGRVHGELSCTTGNGAERRRVTFEGEYGTRRFEIRDRQAASLTSGLDVSASGTRPVTVDATIVMRTTARHVGECTGDEQTGPP